MAKEPKRLGDLLIERGVLEYEDLQRAIDEQKRTGQMLGSVLVRLALVEESVLLDCLHKQLGLPLVDLDATVPDEQALATVREDMAKKYLAIPIEVESRRTLVVAMADPLNVAALEDLRFHTGMFIRPVLAAVSQISDAIERYYHIDTSMNEVIQSIIASEEEIVVSAVAEDDERQAIDELLKEAGVDALPEAHRAVLVGTKIGPGSVHLKDDGTEVQTLWGELAWQLGGAEG